MDLGAKVIRDQNGPAVAGHRAGSSILVDHGRLSGRLVHTGCLELPDGLERPGSDVDQRQIGVIAAVGDQEVPPVRGQGHVLGEEAVNDGVPLFVNRPGVVLDGDVPENRRGGRIGEVDEVDETLTEVGDNGGLPVRCNYSVEEPPAVRIGTKLRGDPLHLPVQEPLRKGEGPGVHRLDRTVNAVDGDQPAHPRRSGLPLHGSLGTDRGKSLSLRGLGKIVLIRALPAEVPLLILGEDSRRKDKAQQKNPRHETTTFDHSLLSHSPLHKAVKKHLFP